MVFFVNLVANACRTFFLLMFQVITDFFRKFNSFIIAFKNKVSDFIECHIFFVALTIFRIYMVILRLI